MRAVIQRVAHAKVVVEGEIRGEIEKGFLVLLGVGEGDTAKEAATMAEKVANLRIFTDENDKMNLSLLTVGGSALVISNFTLYGDTSHGRRPSFFSAAAPDSANELYERFCALLKEQGVQKVEKGVFGAHMEVSLMNDGPVTLILDTKDWK